MQYDKLMKCLRFAYASDAKIIFDAIWTWRLNSINANDSDIKVTIIIKL